MRFFAGFILLAGCFTAAYSQQSAPQATSYNQQEAFVQEYHEAYPVADSAGENNVRSIAIDKSSTVYIATAAGVFKKDSGLRTWSLLPFAEEDKGPAYTVAVDANDVVWLGTWKGLFKYQQNGLQQLTDVKGPVSVVCIAKEGVYALGPNGVWLAKGAAAEKKDYHIAHSVRCAVSDNKEGLWIASDVGVYHATKNATTYLYKTTVLLSAYTRGLAFDNKGNLWITGLGGVSVINNGKRQNAITPAGGCPSIYTDCVKQSPGGVMWVGTKAGVVRFYPDGKHSLLFSRRWLLGDQVNDIAFDRSGNAWIATANGVSAIKSRRITLADKQDYFYEVLMKRHIREPWIAGQCRLSAEGDTTRWQPEDDDNDGEYTGNYLAMESFRYAATKDEDARNKAKKAFHFLKQLQEVTNGDGFFARTIVPANWTGKLHDTNLVYNEKELAEELVKEPRFKPVEVRWHKSADGKWLWKGDASSDEWCGHMMGYYFYYTLAADEEEKKIVRQHVALLADHLIAHDYNMMDIDGKHTRWSVWSPKSLNGDPEWAPDRCQNSMELLTFLKLAYHCTGNEKYQQHYLNLIKKEHYLDNMSGIKDQNPAWFVYYDVTMQAYLYPILLHCEKDPALLAFYRRHLNAFMQKRANDQNPLINFLYCYASDKKAYGQSSVNFLKDTPLDLVDWHIDHTQREDIRLVHTPSLSEWQCATLPPASIRGTIRWDNNPWNVVNGNPVIEREPVFWLYPYWMGRYLKMIE